MYLVLEIRCKNIQFTIIINFYTLFFGERVNK